MRCRVRFLCICVLGVMPAFGCGPPVGVMLCQGVMCDDDGNECTEDVCNPGDGTCGVPLEDGSACTDGACLDGVCTAVATVSGIVNVIDLAPAGDVNATVSVIGTTLRTTTDERGMFSFDVFPGDRLFQAAKEGMWGEIEMHTVLPDGRTNVEFSVHSDAVIEGLSELPGVEIDETKGFAWLNFSPRSDEGGETATLSEPHVGAFTGDANDDLVASEELLPGGSADLTFLNVGLTDELRVTPVGVDGVNICELKYPAVSYPVLARVLTSVSVSCTPSP